MIYLDTVLLALVLAFLVVVMVTALYSSIGKGRHLASALTGTGLLALTVTAFFRLLEQVIK